MNLRDSGAHYDLDYDLRDCPVEMDRYLIFNWYRYPDTLAPTDTDTDTDTDTCVDNAL